MIPFLVRSAPPGGRSQVDTFTEYDIAYRINLIDNDFSPPCFDLSLQIFGFTESSDKEYVLCREQNFSGYVRDEGNKPTFGRARR